LPETSNKSSVTNSLLSGKLSSNKKPLFDPEADERELKSRGRLFF
jgi:hypothetical protein